MATIRLPALTPDLTPPTCYAALGVPPWASRDEVDRHHAARYRAARRADDGGAAQAALNVARDAFLDPEKDAERRFWTFPVPLAPDDLDLAPEAAPPPDAAAVRAAVQAAPWR